MKLRQISLVREAPQERPLQVLKKVDLDLVDGDRMALIGPNGSGKTTLLRILAGIFTPSSGAIQIPDDVETVLDSGFGLDLWLSGYENSRTRLTLSGIPRDQMRHDLLWIREFSGLGDAFEQPVKTYSTGMMTRLAFSITCSRGHDALLIDEGFGTTDSEFQSRANSQLNHILKSTSILVFASHNNALLKEYCNRAVLLVDGAIDYLGPIDIGLSRYDQLMRAKINAHGSRKIS